MAAASRLAALIAQPASAVAEAEAPEHCELCDAPIATAHRHLLDRHQHELICACRPCALLFDRAGAANGRYTLVPETRRRLAGFVMDDVQWEELRIPVDIAFLTPSTAQGRVVAFYPGPMGPVESLLTLDAWQRLADDNPPLAHLAPDVEALLVNRVRGAREHWLVGIDECYRLVGLIRTRWRGLSGGREVWDEIDRFFDQLDRRNPTWPT